MSSCSIRSAAEIARHIRSQLATMNYRRPDKAESRSHLRGFWDQIASRRATVEIVSDLEFRVTSPLADYSESLRRDFFDGAVRISKLNQAAQTLKKGSCASAWVLTTVYYSTFFAAIELLRAHGRHLTYLDDDDVATLDAAAVSSAGKLTPSTYVGERSLRISENVVELFFRRHGDRPHKLAWDEYRPIVRGGLRRIDDEDPTGPHLLRILQAGQDKNWPLPSTVRNQWNYSDPLLFGSTGETHGKKFVQLVGTPNGALAWGASKLTSTVITQAASLAFLSAHMHQVLSEVSSGLLAENQIKELGFN